MHELFGNAGSVVLQLAILWDIESGFLEKGAKSCINGASEHTSRHEIVEIYPYPFAKQRSDEIDEKWEYPFDKEYLEQYKDSIDKRLGGQWGYWRYYFKPEKVYAHDLALAYLAWMGDESAKRKLEESYKAAPDPKGMRDIEDKDKRYWYMLLCLVELPEQPPPRVPDVE